jgi:arylformamidase
MARFYDITLPIVEGMLTYPDDPGVSVRPHSRIADGDDANVTALAFGSHTGTHVDAASHFVDGGQTVDRLPLERLVGPVLVVHMPANVTAMGPDELRGAGLDGATRVLLRTRNAALLNGDEFSEDFAYLTGDGARYLVDAGVELVGIDYLSVEAFDAEEPVAHRVLLEREVVILEGVDLREVPAGRYELLCLPLKLAGLDGAPVRAVLRTLDPAGDRTQETEGNDAVR